MVSRPESGFEPRRIPAQARGQATVAAILEASVRILRREGRAALNTNRVAEIAGVSIGTLYGYFPDKDALCIALARQILQEDRRVLMQAVEEAKSEDALRVLISTLLARHRSDREVRRLVMSFYISSGFGHEHDAMVEDAVHALALKSGHLLGIDVKAIDPVRLFVVSRAVFGIARALTEQGEAEDLPLKILENEVVGFIRTYLAGTTENTSDLPDLTA